MGDLTGGTDVVCMSDFASRCDRSMLVFPSWTRLAVRDLTEPGLSVLLFGDAADGQEPGCLGRQDEGAAVTRSTRVGAVS